MEKLREVDGEGVPQVRQWVTLLDHTTRWGVEYPNEHEWSCCRDTDIAWFATWEEAIEFARTRRWEE